MTKNKNNLVLKISTAAAFLLMITVNALANILPIAGVGTGEVSDSYANLFAPAAITFSIWGIIYILLLAYTLFQLGLFRKGDGNDGLIKKVSLIFLISSLINTAWIFSWHYEIIWLSLILMVGLFVSLMLIILELKKSTLSTKEKMFIKIPFAVYFGWITVALIANVTTFLVSIGWAGFGLSEPFWTALMVSVGAVIGIATTLSAGGAAYGMVLIWAYAGILIKHMSLAGFMGRYTGVVLAVSISLALLAAAVIIELLKGGGKKEKI